VLRLFRCGDHGLDGPAFAERDGVHEPEGGDGDDDAARANCRSLLRYTR
jgi:hypothetical protein